MMAKQKLSAAFIARCNKIEAKRPRTVIQHILKHEFITTEELKETYKYSHPPRAVRDVKDNGIPIEMFKVKDKNGRSIAAYRFGDPSKARFGRLSGRSAFAKDLKKKLLIRDGAKCAVYLETLREEELQVDHRIPFEIAGDSGDRKTEDFMLLSRSANRAKSWSCEHCPNWTELKDPKICQECYWAHPESYAHIAMRRARRLDIMWLDEEVAIYERLKRKTEELQQEMPAYVKKIIEKSLDYSL